MKKIIQIARLEISLLFYSPIAWLLVLVFLVQMNLVFIPNLKGLVQLQQLGLDLTFVTDYLFTASKMGLGGIYLIILKSLFLYVPLLTMGIISRETNSGTIKLLFSSPVKISEVVYGKFLSMMVYNLVIVGVMGLFFVFGIFFIDHIDYPHVLVALLACYLLLCAYAAVGIFMSSLTTYQVVAGISTFLVLTLLSYIGGYGQGIDFVRDLTHSLALGMRTKNMIAGLLNTRDVIYYVVICGIFLAFTISKLELARSSKPFLHQLGRYVMIMVLGLAVAYTTSRQPLIAYYDATETDANTILKSVQKTLQDMGEDPLEITTYVNAMDESYNYGAPIARISSIERWEPYLRFKSNIKLKWVYYYDNIPGLQNYAESQGKSLRTLFIERAKTQDLDTAKFIGPEELRKMVDLSGEDGRMIMHLKWKNKSTFLRTFIDGWPGEAETAAALKRLVVTPPKIVFSTDGYQRSVDKLGDRDYKMLMNIKFTRSSLINQGFDIDSVSIEQAEIPTGTAALVIGDPKIAFSSLALAKIKKYIADGGNLMVSGEPGKQVVVNPLLETLGIKMLNGTVVQRSRDYSFGLVTTKLTKGTEEMSAAMVFPESEKAVVAMPGLAALGYEGENGFNTKPVLVTDAKTSWIKKGAFILDSAALVFEAKNGDERGAFPGALTLSRKINNKEQRILISGDADFFSNKEMGRGNLKTVNSSFAISVFSWFSNNEFPIDISRPKGSDNKLKLNRAGFKTVQIIYYGVIPVAIVLLGMVLLIRRKRK